jgi:predicted AlkP superfamily phosphohydrolase/phosphomutase
MKRTANLLLALTTALTISCRATDEKAKVVVLGFDGANWETIDPLIEAGKLPFLKRLKEQSAWAYLQTFKPTKSPVIWTSIATGKTMIKHGILDFVFIEKNQIQVPYSNSERRAPALWEILDHFNKRSVVNNWFVTYPPDPINGVMVSNRFRKRLLLKGDRIDSVRDSVHPPEYFDRLSEFANHDYAGLLEENGLPDVAAAYEQTHPGRSHTDIAVLKDFWVYVLQEAFNESVSQHLYQTEDFDFFASYFRLPDIVQHFALTLMDQEQLEAFQSRLKAGEFTEEDQKLFERQIAGVLEPFYRYMEKIIENFMTSSRYEDAYFIIVSDHGFTFHSGGYDHYHIPDNLPAPNGIFLMNGPEIKRGQVPFISVYDIAPTILHLFDLPIGKEMDGRPVTEALLFEREQTYQIYSADMMTPKNRKRDSELEQSTLEELKALGYIQ